MSVDYITLTLAGAMVAFVCGLLLLAAWTQYENSRVAPILGASHILAALAIVLLATRGFLTGVPVGLAQPAFVLAAFLALVAARAFDRRPMTLWLLATAIGATLLVVAVSSTQQDAGLLRILQLTIVTPTFAAAAATLWRGRDGLRARLPLAAIFLLHAMMSAVGLTEAILQDALPSGIASFSNWYGAVHVESMIYFIGTTLFLVSLLKESSETGHRLAALTDPLTGLPNRRAFFSACDRLLAERRRNSAPVSVVVVDLDRFKSVNDTFGHAVGDQVLGVFANVVREQLRSDDIVGRIGGEEFAIVLPNTNASEGSAIAERLRAAFADAARRVGGHDVNATFSGGATCIVGQKASIAEALEEADAALYRAKLNGRNRIEFAPRDRKVRLVI